MSDILGPILAGASNFLGALTGASATEKGAELAYKAQMKTNAMEVDLANTAHQREVADLKAAGLNPLLSAHGSGASTPTLQAPTARGEGLARAGQQVGNAMAQLPSQVLQFMAGQQQIELTRAQTDKAREEAGLVHAETIGKNQENVWYPTINAQHLAESQTHVAEMTQATTESKARTATIEAMRQPEIQKIVADAAKAAQETKTEEQRTRELEAAADNAKKLYGAKASEAATIAAQMATLYTSGTWLSGETNKVKIQDMQIKLMNDEHFQKVIQNILDNDYGRLDRWAKINANPWQTGATTGQKVTGNAGKVTTSPVPQ